MSKLPVSPAEREPGLVLSVLVAASLLFSLFIFGGIRLIQETARQTDSAKVEITLEVVASEADELTSSEAAPAETPPAETTEEPEQVAAIPEPAASERVETAVVSPGEPVPPVEPDVLVAPAVNPPDATVAEPLTPEPAAVETPVVAKPEQIMPSLAAAAPTTSVLSATSFSLPGNMDLMPAPRPSNRLNPMLAGMPNPARPQKPEALPTVNERGGSESAVSVPAAAASSGAAAPELQVTPLSGNTGSRIKKGNSIKVMLLINHLGIVEGVEILEGSGDKVGDVLAAKAMQQQRYKFNPPLPAGQRVLRTEYITMGAEALP
jgi:hypothetical protein